MRYQATQIFLYSGIVYPINTDSRTNGTLFYYSDRSDWGVSHIVIKTFLNNDDTIRRFANQRELPKHIVILTSQFIDRENKIAVNIHMELWVHACGLNICRQGSIC